MKVEATSSTWSLNSHVHFHMLVTDGVFSTDPDDHEQTIFHPAGDMREWQHGDGWSVDATVCVAGWDHRQGLERLVCNIARPPLASSRLGGRVN